MNVKEINTINKYLRQNTEFTFDISIYLSIGINVRFAAMMADVGDGLL